MMMSRVYGTKHGLPHFGKTLQDCLKNALVIKVKIVTVSPGTDPTSDHVMFNTILISL